MADVEEGMPLQHQGELDDKTDKALRHGFVRKVFSIVFIQLLITTAIAYPFAANPVWGRTFVQDFAPIVIIAAFLPLVLVCYISCFPNVGREYPKNYIVLTILTLAMGLIVGVVCIQYTGESIVLAAGITAAVAFSLILFAMQTTYDFSGAGPYLWVAFVVLFCMGLVLTLFPMSTGGGVFEQIYCGVGALLFSFYIVYDTQLITGGKHQQFRLSLDDYVFGALALYLDIINLFLFILRIMGDRR